MDEENVRFYAGVVARQAKIAALQAEMQGMLVANRQRVVAAETIGYTEESFIELADELHRISDDLLNM